ncbi:HesA/MoeB/ThiF family protein [Pararhodobacter zhoushanensis]|uniref:HesA/MoeB/ThiF family protein n=1 Tax=Pararhodobacter zhoushanensis TaxID=2479545 RepID=UPI000F8EA070|nr:HesA/MoeB/ThiF family protein [Pararhodobacter zhoushanensis]
MMALLFAAAALWALAWVFGVPMRVRLVVLGVVWLAIVAAHLLLPAEIPFRVNTGGDARPWLVLAILALAVWGYRALLARLRNRAHAKAPAQPDTAPKPVFTDTELTRYARHMMLREVGGPGQRALKQAKVLVIGAGGLGSPALLYLAAAGVGTIGVIDDDTVDGTNLQRQIIHTDARIGMPKVFSAQAQMQALNPFVTVQPYNRRLTEAEAEQLFAQYDLILDGTDNFDTRYLTNRIAVQCSKPLIAAAITQWEGQIALYDPARGGPCFECLFPERPAPGLVPSCAEAGVIAPLPGVLGSMMAVEALKTLTHAGASLRGALVIYDGLYGESRRMTTHARADCPVCHGKGATA